MTFKEFLKSKSISDSDFASKSAEDVATLQGEYNDAVREELKAEIAKASTKDELKVVETKMNDFLEKNKEVNDKSFNELKDQCKTMGEELTKLKEKGGADAKPLSFQKAYKEVAEDVVKIVKGNIQGEVIVKADTVRASIINNSDDFIVPGIGQLGVIRRSLYDVFPKFPVADGDNQGVAKYTDWDEATTIRAASMIAEGGAFLESTAKFEQFSIPLRKVGDILPVSDEFGTDQVSAAAELEMFLDTNVKTKVDDQLINGDGTGQNLTGLIVTVPAYTASAEGIAGANIYDLVKRVKTDITETRGSKYMPDICIMNANTMDELHLTKDLNENYVFRDVMNIGNIILIEDNNLADNVLVVGDRRYGRIYEKGGVVLSRGLVDGQFGEDMISIKARTRLLFLIRNVDKTGFRKVTSISAALATLAT